MDNDFSYDDEVYELSDDSGIIDEFALDDIRSEIDTNPLEAAEKLRAMAENHASAHCINAALELVKLDTTPKSFETLLQAILHGNKDIDSYNRIAALDQGLSIYRQVRPDNLLVEDLQSAINADHNVSSEPKKRVMLKLWLVLAAALIRMQQFDAALNLLVNKFDQLLNSTSHVWAAALRHESIVLRLEIEACVAPVNLEGILRYLSELQATSNIGVVLPWQTCVINEISARFWIETHQLERAKPLLEATVRAYEESVSTLVLPSTRSFMLLILVSTVLQTGLPVSAASKRQVRGIDAALEMADLITGNDAREASRVKQMLDACRQWMNTEQNYVLGTEAILKQVWDAYILEQTKRALKTYSRIRIGDFQGAVNTDKEQISVNTIAGYIANGSLALPNEDFRLNLVDNSIDRVHGLPWPNLPVRNHTVPFPPKYLERNEHISAHRADEQVLGNLRLPKPQPSTRPTARPVDETYVMLIHALEKHREAMLA